jgi:UDP-N-acetylglucosamine enolpyruvyl transferase
VRVRAAEVGRTHLDAAAAARIRASILLAGPMLARTGGMQLPPPGGDVIGRRRHGHALPRAAAARRGVQRAPGLRLSAKAG